MPYRMADYGGADTLDGLDSTAFFILAGQAGGQVGIGGTAASNILTFESTSHATKGYIHFRDDLRLASGADIFDANSNELLRFTQTASATNEFTIVNAATTVRPTFRSSGEANIGLILADSNSNEFLIFTSTASAVNEFTIANAATGANPSITASGGDTNISINLIPKGTGVAQVSGNEIYRVGGTDVSLADGGTAASLTASVGGIFYSTASAGAILAGTATAGQIVRSGSSAAPTWSTATYPATAGATAGMFLRSDGTNFGNSTLVLPNAAAISTILYASAADTISALATANSGVLVTSGTGVPSIATDIPTAVTIGTAYIYRVGGTDVALADGGTAASLTASVGGIFYSTASAGAILAGTATAGQILRSGASAAPAWSTATYPATAGSAGVILRSDGTNLVTSTATYPNTAAINTILYASAADTISALATANSGVLNTSATGVPSITATPVISTSLTVGLAGTSTGSLLLRGTTSGTVTITTAAAAGTYTLTLPIDDGTASQFLQTDGAGVLTWATPSAGANTALSNLDATTAINSNLTFAQGTARSVITSRTTTGAGINFTVEAAGAQSGGTNLAGGNLILTSGIATGTGSSSVSIQTVTAGATGTADRTATTKLQVNADGTTTFSTATSTDDQIIISPFVGGAARFAGTITSVDLTAARTWTLPDTTTTLAGLAVAQTFTQQQIINSGGGASAFIVESTTSNMAQMVQTTAGSQAIILFRDGGQSGTIRGRIGTEGVTDTMSMYASGGAEVIRFDLSAAARSTLDMTATAARTYTFPDHSKPQMAQYGILATTSFEATGRFSVTTASSGTNTFGTGGADITTGTTTDSYVQVRYTPTATNSLQIFNNDPVFTCSLEIRTISASSGQIYVGMGGITTAGTGHTFTNNHIGFKFLTSTGTMSLYATQANGTSEDDNAAISLTTAAVNDNFDLLAIRRGTAVDYYWSKNGGAWSAATSLTTFAPTTTTAEANIQVSVSNVSTTNATRALVGSVSYRR